MNLESKSLKEGDTNWSVEGKRIWFLWEKTI